MSTTFLSPTVTATTPAIPQLWSITNGRLVLHQHPGQTRAWLSERRFILVLAGTQGGKTSWGPYWLWREMMRRGPGDYLAVTSSYDLFKLKLLPVMREAFEHVLGIGRYWAGAGVIEIADPSTGEFLADRADGRMWGRIILRSALSRGGLESSTAAAAWLDEAGQDAFTIDVWEAVLRRLSLHRGRALITTTIYNLGYLKDLYNQWVAGDPDFDVIQFRSTLNPAFEHAEFERAKRSMQKHRFKMFYEGEFATPPGQIYSLPDAQVILRFPIRPEWERYVGVDFGAVNTALVWLALDPEQDRYILYRTSLAGNKTTAQHCEETLALATGENVIGYYGGSGSERQQRMDWTAAGVPVTAPPVGNLEAGIDRVTHLIITGQLYVFSDLTGILAEFQGYSREMDDHGNVYDAIRDKETFHQLDALRYVATVVVGGQVVDAPSLWD